MLAYAAYRRPQNIEFYSICKKNTRILAYVQFLLYLCSRKRKTYLTIHTYYLLTHKKHNKLWCVQHLIAFVA